MNAQLRSPSDETFPLERSIVLLVHSAIAGASIAAVLQLASRETFPPLLLVSLACFAVSIPAALALVILSQVIYGFGQEFYGLNNLSAGQNWPALSFVLAVADQVACFAGLLALFWHFHWIIGAIFLLASALAFITTWLADRRLKQRRA
jgi:hypothetical protein